MNYQTFLRCVILLSVSLFLCSCGIVGVEKISYTVLEKEGAFEVRQYEPYWVAETRVDADFDEAGNVAFRRLYKYISGHNQLQTSIAMTAPVNQSPQSEKISMTAPVNQQTDGGQYIISFVMPSKYTQETLPQPLDAAVIVKEVSGYKAAAVRYSGTWSQKRYEIKKAALEAYIKANSLTANGRPVFARYDPPFQIWFLRRNEVVIPIE